MFFFPSFLRLISGDSIWLMKQRSHSSSLKVAIEVVGNNRVLEQRDEAGKKWKRALILKQRLTR